MGGDLVEPVGVGGRILEEMARRWPAAWPNTRPGVRTRRPGSCLAVC
jgi:hypothetical protein